MGAGVSGGGVSGGKRGSSARTQLVRQIMKEKGLSLPQASKHIKRITVILIYFIIISKLFIQWML